MSRFSRQLELLLVWILPVTWMGFCFYAFRQWEPSKTYANSIAFLFLALFWLFQRSKLRLALGAGRARTWGRAAVFCVSGGVTGLIFFVFFPITWAFWFVFFPGLIVIIGIVPDKSKGSAGAADGESQRRGPGEDGRISLISLLVTLLSLAGIATFYLSGRRNEVQVQKLRAAFGSVEARLALGQRYREGQGVPQDFSAAAHWFERAAQSGSARAQYDLGLLHYYELGELSPTEENGAQRWFERAAQQDYAPAVTMLGLMAAQDENDTVKAMEHWQRAVALHDPWAEYLLGAAYLNRKASASINPEVISLREADERDLILALFWLEMARRDGVEPIGGMLQHVWATVPSGSFEQVSREVLRGLKEGLAP